MACGEALEVDHEQVRVVALQVGVRESARQFGLPEGTVLWWSQQEGWFANRALQNAAVKQAIDAKRERQGLQSTPIAASDVLANYTGPTRLLHAKVDLRIAQHIASKPDEEIYADAGTRLAHVKAAALTGAWNQQITNIGIRLDAVAGSVGVNMSQPGQAEGEDELE